jgi:sugar lactone lactonase YvrE
VEAILQLPSNLPQHAETQMQPVSAKTIIEWPVGTFVENLAILSDGSIAVSVHTSNAVERIDPNGQRSIFVTLPEPPAGLVARQSGGFYVASGNPGMSPGRVWRVSADGKAEMAVEVEDALFLNGLTPLNDEFLLTADSIRGCIYRLNIVTGKADIWLADQRLKKVTNFPFMPGANGIKVFEDEVYITNTEQALFLRVEIKADRSAGLVEITGNQLRGDDLAFDVDGNAYLATHIENTIVRVSQNGERIAVAGPDQGMPGSTAVAFGRTPADKGSLYVTTTGGLLRPYQGVLQSAKLVKLELGIDGAAIPLVD